MPDLVRQFCYARRPFFRIALKFAASLLICARSHAQAPSDNVVTIRVDSSIAGVRIFPDFLGFGYETSAVAQSNFFSATNLTMIQLYRNLSQHGLMRIGGIISDHTKYVPDGIPAARTQTEVTIINQKNLAGSGGLRASSRVEGDVGPQPWHRLQR